MKASGNAGCRHKLQFWTNVHIVAQLVSRRLKTSTLLVSFDVWRFPWWGSFGQSRMWFLVGPKTAADACSAPGPSKTLVATGFLRNRKLTEVSMRSVCYSGWTPKRIDGARELMARTNGNNLSFMFFVGVFAMLVAVFQLVYVVIASCTTMDGPSAVANSSLNSS